MRMMYLAALGVLLGIEAHTAVSANAPAANLIISSPASIDKIKQQWKIARHRSKAFSSPASGKNTRRRESEAKHRAGEENNLPPNLGFGFGR